MHTGPVAKTDSENNFFTENLYIFGMTFLHATVNYKNVNYGYTEISVSESNVREFGNVTKPRFEIPSGFFKFSKFRELNAKIFFHQK